MSRRSQEVSHLVRQLLLGERNPAELAPLDVDLAHAVCTRDDDLDALYDANYAEVIGSMLMEPNSAKILTYQLWTAHNLERIGDRATNICERVVYLVTGRMEEENVSRY